MKAVNSVDIVDGKCVVTYSDGSEQELYDYPSDDGGGGTTSGVSSVNGMTGDVVIPTATTSVNGLMSKTDKGNLDIVRGQVSNLNSAITQATEEISQVTGETRNLFNLDNLYVGYAWNGSVNTTRACAYIPILGGEKYIISFPSETASRFDAITVFEKVNISDTANLYLSGISTGFTRTASASAKFLGIQFTKTAITEADLDGIVLQVEYGDVVTPYIQNKTAVDLDVRNNLVLYTTPEKFGAWGDGVHDDTVALQTALNTGKNVYAPNKYKISASISMSPVYPTGQRLVFGSIICTINATALKLNGRCGVVDGLYIESKGNCISFGETALTYDWNVNVSVLNSTSGACVQYGGGNGNVSEIKLTGKRYNYTTVGINILPVGGFVGQIHFDGMTFNTEDTNGGYAFYANGATYPMTGLTCYNVSLEGAHGGFQFINSQVSTPINPIYCFGLRTSELTVVNGYKLLRLTGNGIIAGDIFCDIFTLDSIDVALHNPDITLEQSLNFHGRISGYGRGWRNVRIVGNRVIPTWNEEYAGNVSNPTYNDSNLPYTVNLFSGTASWTVDFQFDGTVTFISTADGSTLTINETTITMNNTQRCVIRTVADQTSVHVMVLRPNGTEIPVNLVTT